MLVKITFTIIVLLGVCNANLFEDRFKKFGSFDKNAVRHFAVDIPKEIEQVADRGVKTKSQELLEKLRSSLLLKGAPLGSIDPQRVLPLFGLQHPAKQKSVGLKPQHPLRLTSYKIANCSGFDVDKTKVIIKQLDITPDPLKFPGTINFTFDIQMLEEFSENFKIDLVLRIKQGDSFIKVPCIGSFGSCIYEICEMLKLISSCPPQLVDQGIPCKCPFEKRTYTASGISAGIDTSVFITGDYNVTAHMKYDGAEVGCYTAAFTVSN